VETPLKGGLNTPLHTLDFSGPASARQVVATPNTVLAAVAATPRSIVDQTPGSQTAASTPGSTPFRDQLNINQEPSNDLFIRDNLRKQFKNLPKPANDFELMAPEEEEIMEEDQEEVGFFVGSDKNYYIPVLFRNGLKTLQKSTNVKRSK
jgi:pre-mRNA-splicing factor CDC5/CEF1